MSDASYSTAFAHLVLAGSSVWTYRLLGSGAVRNYQWAYGTLGLLFVNSCFGVMRFGVSCRSARNLKTCYENLKRKTRKICADNKVMMNATGGGNFKPTLSKTTEKVMALIQPTITPLMNAHDSDALYQGHVNEVLVLPFEDVELEERCNETEAHETGTLPAVVAPSADAAETCTQSQGQAEALNPLIKPPINSLTQPCLPSSHTAVQPSTSADTVLSNRAKSRRRRLSTPRDKITDACERRISVLDYQLEVMRKEHEKEMEIRVKTKHYERKTKILAKYEQERR
ncbi:uncharacterized protein [Anabrus simplex]|uniref:uncharacterized protein n=1 Tax=Anabrus simplex TaxID=316456 RepID=UPI0035A33DEE